MSQITQIRNKNQHHPTTKTVKISFISFKWPLTPTFNSKRKERRERIPGKQPPPLLHKLKPNEGKKPNERQDKNVHNITMDEKSKINKINPSPNLTQTNQKTMQNKQKLNETSDSIKIRIFAPNENHQKNQHQSELILNRNCNIMSNSNEITNETKQNPNEGNEPTTNTNTNNKANRPTSLLQQNEDDDLEIIDITTKGETNETETTKTTKQLQKEDEEKEITLPDGVKTPGWSANKMELLKSNNNKNDPTNPNTNTTITTQQQFKLNSTTETTSGPPPPPPTLTQIDMVEPPPVNLIYVRDTNSTSPTTTHPHNANMITHYLISAKPIVQTPIKPNTINKMADETHSGSKRKRPENQDNEPIKDKDEDDDIIMTKSSKKAESTTPTEPKSKRRKTNDNTTTKSTPNTGTPERTKSNIFNNLFGDATNTKSSDNHPYIHPLYYNPYNIRWDILKSKLKQSKPLQPLTREQEAAITEKDTKRSKPINSNNTDNTTNPTPRRSKRIAAKQNTQQTPQQNTSSPTNTKDKVSMKIPKKSNTKIGKKVAVPERFKTETAVMSVYLSQPDWDPLPESSSKSNKSHIMIGRNNYVEAGRFLTVVDQSKRRREELRNVNQQNSKLKHQLKQEKEKTNNKSSKITELKSKVNEILKESQNVKTRMKQKDNKIYLLQKEINALKEKDKENTNTIKQNNENIKNWERKYQNQKSKIKNQQNEINNQNSKLKNYEKNDQAMFNNLKEIRSKLIKTQQRANDLQQELNHKNADLDAANMNYQTAKESLDSVINDKDALLSEIQRKDILLNSINNSNKQTTPQIQSPPQQKTGESTITHILKPQNNSDKTHKRWVEFDEEDEENDNKNNTEISNTSSNTTATTITRKTPALNLTISTAQKKLSNTYPIAEGLIGIKSKMAINVYDTKETQSIPNLVQAFDIMENLKHDIFVQIASKSISKRIPFHHENAEIAACTLTARGTNDHRIGSIAVSQLDIADDIMEAVANAVPTTFNVMQQIVMRCRGKQDKYSIKIPVGNISSNTATLILAVGKTSLQLSHDNDSGDTNKRENNRIAILTESGKFDLTVTSAEATDNLHSCLIWLFNYNASQKNTSDPRKKDELRLRDHAQKVYFKESKLLTEDETKNENTDDYNQNTNSNTGRYNDSLFKDPNSAPRRGRGGRYRDRGRYRGPY